MATCLGLAAGICVPYWTLQHVDVGWPVEVPALGVDAAIPFAPAWTPVYLSLGVLVPLAPWLCGDRESVLRYAQGLTLLCVPSFLVFALLPAAGPRPEADAAVPALYAWLVSADRPTNSLPSLHAGLTVYSLLVIDTVAGRSLPGASRVAGWALGGAWGAGILFSTLATKQHQALDLPPGMALAAVAWWLAFRERSGRPPPNAAD